MFSTPEPLRHAIFRVAKTFPVLLFVIGLVCVLSGFFLTSTILYPYWMEWIDQFLMLMSLLWGVTSFVHAAWLYILFLRDRAPEDVLWKGMLSVCGIGLAWISLVFMAAQTFSTQTLVKSETVGGKTFYVYDTSFLEIACQVDVRNGIFLQELYPFDPGCDPKTVSFIVDDQSIQVLLSNQVRKKYPLF